MAEPLPGSSVEPTASGSRLPGDGSDAMEASSQMPRAGSRIPHPVIVFIAIFLFIFLLHLPLLHLPYFWDEAGYYVPAARDLLFTGSLIPHTTVSNAHPPLVLAWLALCWKIAGYTPVVTRSAM